MGGLPGQCLLPARRSRRQARAHCSVIISCILPPSQWRRGTWSHGPQIATHGCPSKEKYSAVLECHRFKESKVLTLMGMTPPDGLVAPESLREICEISKLSFVRIAPQL